MDSNMAIPMGLGVAISVLGFFLKKEARKAQEMDDRIKTLEVMIAQNNVRDEERWNNVIKSLEDRRVDIKTVFEKLEGKASV
jgi:hypothetical protein